MNTMVPGPMSKRENSRHLDGPGQLRSEYTDRERVQPPNRPLALVRVVPVAAILRVRTSIFSLSVIFHTSPERSQAPPPLLRPRPWRTVRSRRRRSGREVGEGLISGVLLPWRS